MPYTRPVNPTWLDSWQSHRDRRPTSREPGTDYGCAIGTPVHAPADFIVRETYDGIGPAHGRFVAGDLLDGSGRSFRDMHLLRRHVSVGDRVPGGTIFALSGATGYGVEDWSNDGTTNGAHVHRTLLARPWWQASQQIWNTLDPEAYSDSDGVAGGGSSPFNSPTTKQGVMDMPLHYEAVGGNDYVRPGQVYAKDGPGNAWRGLTDLATFMARGSVPIPTIAAADLATLFALEGVSEQPEWLENHLPWGNGNRLNGLGAPTGRIKFPGHSDARLAEWHYPRGSA